MCICKQIVMDKKLSHKQYRRLIKKLKRKRKRKEIALKREEEDLENEKTVPCVIFGPDDQRLKWIEDEQEREIAHIEWLEREIKAQKEFETKREIEERKKRETKIKEQKIREEWERQQQKEKDEEERKNKEIQKKREREESLLKTLSTPSNKPVQDGPSHNPEAPPNYGTELDRQNCPFFLKTGACRFGDRCSRIHFRPAISCTLLIPKMYNHFSIGESFRDEYDTDIALEYDDNETYQHFREFYDDVVPEFKKIGKVIQFKTCCNHEPHLRGNVYVQYQNEEDALNALHKFNGRWYAGKQISCEFTSITKWKSAICGLFAQKRCPKGKSCNFLHVFRNPRNEFFSADFDNSDHNKNDSERNYNESHRSSQRSSSSMLRESTRKRSHTSSRRDSKERRHEEKRIKRSRSKSHSRSRSNSHSSRSKSKKHKRKKKKNYQHSDEDSSN